MPTRMNYPFVLLAWELYRTVRRAIYLLEAIDGRRPQIWLAEGTLGTIERDQRSASTVVSFLARGRIYQTRMVACHVYIAHAKLTSSTMTWTYRQVLSRLEKEAPIASGHVCRIQLNRI